MIDRITENAPLDKIHSQDIKIAANSNILLAYLLAGKDFEPIFDTVSRYPFRGLVTPTEGILLSCIKYASHSVQSELLELRQLIDAGCIKGKGYVEAEAFHERILTFIERMPLNGIKRLPLVA